MNYSKYLPDLIFHIDKMPEEIEDLSLVEESVTELFITGDTKNLEKLRLMERIEKLWIHSVKQKDFDFILGSVNPEFLLIYDLKVEKLAAIELLTNLKTLSLEWNTKSIKLWDLSKNPKLKTLSIIDFSKLNNIKELGIATQIEVLELSGSHSKNMNLDNLQPLSNLVNLKWLRLSQIKVQDESLKPIANLTTLQELEISNQFLTEEFAMLSVMLPNTNCDKFQPYVKIRPIGDEDIMVVGKRKPWLSSTKKNAQKLEKYKKEFTLLQKKYIDKT